MKNLLSINKPIKYWYLPMILGLLFLGLGITVFLTPLASYIVLAMIFALLFLLTGLIDMVYAITNKDIIDRWGWSLLGGVIDFFIGVLLITKPNISMVVLPFFVGFGILFRSVIAIGWSLELKRLGGFNWGYLLAIGILGAVFSFIMLWNPLFGGLTIVFWSAIGLSAIGVFHIYLSLQLKKINRLPLT